MIVQVLLRLGKLDLDRFGQAGLLIKTALSLIGQYLCADSKLAVVPFTPVINRNVIDLYGNEADYLLRHLQPFLKSKVTTYCSESSCPSPTNTYVTCSTALGIPSDTSDVFGNSLADWLHPKPTACGQKFQQKPATGVNFQQDVTLDANGNTSVSWHCAGQRTSTPRVMTNFQNIVIFSVDLLSRAGMLHINDLPPKITVQGKTFYLQAATLWNGNHYIGTFCDALGCWYLYDGLKVGLNSGIQILQGQPPGYLLSYTVYCT